MAWNVLSKVKQKKDSKIYYVYNAILYYSNDHFKFCFRNRISPVDVFIVSLLLNLSKCLVNNLYRSSFPNMFYKIDVLQEFAKLTVDLKIHSKTTVQEFFKWLRLRCSPVNFGEIFRETFINNTSGRLFLSVSKYLFRVNIQGTTRISMNAFTMSLLLILNRFGSLTLLR